MSRKIIVVGENRDVKKTIALTLVCKAVADWVEKNVSIKMRPAREFNPSSSPQFKESKSYIPQILPPVDLPGIHFQEPQSDTWKMQHRNVSFA